MCEEGLSRGIKEKTFRALLNQQLHWFVKLKMSVGILSNMLSTDTNKISQVLGVRVGSIAWSVVALLGAMAASFALCWPIGLTILPSYIWLLTAGYLHSKFTQRYSDVRNTLLRDGAKTANEAIRNIHTVACFGIEELLIGKYKDQLEQPFRYDLKHAAINGVTYGLSQMWTFLFIGFGYLVGTFLVTSSSFRFTYSDVLISLFTVWFSSQIFKGRFDIIPELQEGALSTHKVLNYFSRRSSLVFKPSGKCIVPRNTEFSLQLKNLWHDNNYPSSREIPGGLKSPPLLFVHPGKTLALVGPGLSRKTTVLSVAEEFDSPSPSSLLLDGIDICDLNLGWLQRQIGIVSKDPNIFSLSVLDNIRYGANFRQVSSEEVISVAQAVGVNEILGSLPEGYRTIVGYNGYELSLEERLCVAIARALIRDPKILFLDDMVLGVNPNVEKTILEALDRARKGRTTIVIAHRLTTIQNADSIAVLHKGRVIEQGTHSELIERKGAYFIMNDILEKF